MKEKYLENTYTQPFYYFISIVTVDLTAPVSGEVVDGVQPGFTDLQYSPSTAKVGTQWRDYYDPESGIKQYEVQVEIARLVIILGYSMVIT
jgi:hypothetical protein